MTVNQGITELSCFCGLAYAREEDLEEHRRARGHFSSHVCGPRCKHPPVKSQDHGPQFCPSCNKYCERGDIFEDHQIFTGHCYCAECRLSFPDDARLKEHLKETTHATEFRCCDCHLGFKDLPALAAHLGSARHKKPPNSSPQSRDSRIAKAGKASPVGAKRQCEQCARSFGTKTALDQHLASLKHKPLSNVSCPLGKGCNKKFTAPSGLLQHLECGRCDSGMTRSRLYQLVQTYDRDLIISTFPGTIPNSPLMSQYSDTWTTTDLVLTPVAGDSDSEWSLLNPSSTTGRISSISIDGSTTLSNRSPSDRDAVEAHISRDRALKCPLCPPSRKGFRTFQALEDHVSSWAHAPKPYKCPLSFATKIVMARGGKGARKFTTLGGLSQHLESGACRGGRATFSRVIEYVQEYLKSLGFDGFSLLLLHEVGGK